MDLVCMGVLIMDMFPLEKGKHIAEVSAYKPTPGGAPANVAVAAKRLGLTCAFIGKVGNDYFGHHLAKVLQNEGIDITGIRYDEFARTTLNFHAKPEENVIEYLFYRNPGADYRLSSEELDLELIKNSKVLHFDSLCLTHEPSKTTTYQAVETARQAGVMVSFDVNYREPVWESMDQFLTNVFTMIKYSDVIKLNEFEVELLYPKMTIETACQKILENGPKLCLVTLGENGSFFMTQEGGKKVSVLDVEVIEPIGCGDAFIGGLLTQIIKNKIDLNHLSMNQLEEFVKYADTVASLTATKYGTIPAMPYLSEVEKFHRGRG
jgi:fructokinase